MKTLQTVAIPELRVTCPTRIVIETLEIFSLRLRIEVISTSAARVRSDLCISAPDAPTIEDVGTGYDYLVVSWQPSDRSPDSNPASVFDVQYRPEGEFMEQVLVFKTVQHSVVASFQLH
jgi:hypothetical protein